MSNRPLSDYVAIALIADISEQDDPFLSFGSGEISGSWEDVRAKAELKCGFKVDDHTVREAVRVLADCGLVRISEDPYAGPYIKISPQKFPDFVKKSQAEHAKYYDEESGYLVTTLPHKADFPNARTILDHPVVSDYAELGEAWFKRALDGLRMKAADANDPLEDSRGLVAPAADRIVRLDDNQIKSIDDTAQEIIDLLEPENSIDGDIDERSRILCQIRAARELIRAGSVRAYLMYETLMQALLLLIQKYKGKALGQVASKFLDMLIEHIFSGGK